MRCCPPRIAFLSSYNAVMMRVVELKLYLTASQESILERWLRSCC
jgi:hypothetical protein